MKQKITIIGSTGLIGSHFLQGIRSNEYKFVNAITRHRISSLEKNDFIKQSVHDFSDLKKMRLDLKTDVLICALGTTIKKAGSEDEFMRIDHNLTVEISKIAKKEGCNTIILISSIGSNSKSNIFYKRVKGLLEESIEDIEFENFHIIRPSLLLGKRKDTRPAENLSKIVLEPISFMIPFKYRPIHACKIAKTIKYIIKEKKSGKHIWEGRKLFEI